MGKKKKKSEKKRFAHKIIYPKSTLCRNNFLLKDSFAKGLAYFLQGVPGMLHLLGRIPFSKFSRDAAYCKK